MSLIDKIPIVRSVVRLFERRSFENAWRNRNRHNETKAGDRFFPLEVVEVGKGSYGNITVQSLYLTPDEKLVIGNYVSIAPDVAFFLGVNHQMNTATTFPFYSKLIERSPIDAITNGPIVVEDEVWIGTGARIFSGIRIGKGAVIAAGSVVTKDVPPYAIFGGNPARLIRYRFSDDIIKILQPVYFADLPEKWIRENIELVYKKIETAEDARALSLAVQSFKTPIHDK